MSSQLSNASNLTDVIINDGGTGRVQSPLIYSFIYAATSIVGLVANCVVIFIVFRCKDMHTPINYSFCNLAITDVLFLAFYAIPATLNGLGYPPWPWVCKIRYYLRVVSFI